MILSYWVMKAISSVMRRARGLVHSAARSSRILVKPMLSSILIFQFSISKGSASRWRGQWSRKRSRASGSRVAVMRC